MIVCSKCKVALKSCSAGNYEWVMEPHVLSLYSGFNGNSINFTTESTSSNLCENCYNEIKGIL